jgi:hypothetical protein
MTSPMCALFASTVRFDDDDDDDDPIASYYHFLRCRAGDRSISISLGAIDFDLAGCDN